MRLLVLGIELLNVTAVQGQHDADPREYGRASVRGDQDEGFHRRLPFRGLVLSLRELRDVGPGIPQRDQLAAARQRDAIVEWSFPAALSYVRHGSCRKLLVFLRTYRQLERAQTIFFFGFLSGPDKRERRVRKLPPDRQIIRCNNKRAEREHVSARLGHAPGFLPCDLLDRPWWLVPVHMGCLS